MKTKLTDRFIRTRKPPASGRLIMTDTAVPGLSLRINPASTKNPDGLRFWLLRYRPRHQAQRSTVLGPYPPLSLADARQRAGDIVNAAKKVVRALASALRPISSNYSTSCSITMACATRQTGFGKRSSASLGMPSSVNWSKRIPPPAPSAVRWRGPGNAFCPGTKCDFYGQKVEWTRQYNDLGAHQEPQARID
jgi:Arm DNA-binding domain